MLAVAGHAQVGTSSDWHACMVVAERAVRLVSHAVMTHACRRQAVRVLAMINTLLHTPGAVLRHR